VFALQHSPGQLAWATPGHLGEHRVWPQAHGNFAEYVPFAVLLLGLVEGRRAAPVPVIAALGVVLLVARVSHGWGLAVRDKKFWLRFLGMAGTYSVLLVESGLLLWSSLRGLAAA